MAEGWIKLHRSILECEDLEGDVASKKEAWISLILWANHKQGKFACNQNVILIDRGQLIGSIVKWGKSWKWSQSKVKRFLNLLKNGERIDYETKRFYTIITILNYSKYQDIKKTDEEDSDIHSKKSRRAVEEQSKTNKNGRMEEWKKKEEYKEPSTEVSAVSPDKIKYLTYVYLTPEQHKAWTDKVGPEMLQAAITKLDGWIGSDPTPKRIKNGKNASACFQSWVMNAVGEDKLKAMRLQPFNGPQQSKQQFNDQLDRIFNGDKNGRLPHSENVGLPKRTLP